MTMSEQFNGDLNWSHDQHRLPFWEDVYRRAFPNMASTTVLPQQSWGQHAGRDRVINLADSSVVYVDEKARRRVRSDILIEVCHEYPRRRRLEPGWIAKPLGIDYLAYAFIPNTTCYLLPFRLLQQTWQENKAAWWSAAAARRQGFWLAEAPNRDYVTKSVCVPIPVLLDAMRDAMVIRWS